MSIRLVTAFTLLTAVLAGNTSPTSTDLGDGLMLEKLEAGDGKTFPQAGDQLTMDYTGTLMADGSKFDSSRDRKEPFAFTIGVGQVIQGWDQGITKMSLGERANLVIPSKMGYGSQGAGGVIPPNADLKFDVKLRSINGKSVGASFLAKDAL